MHVTDSIRESELESGWISFPARDVTTPGVFALDCEMIYTTAGSELARVTVVDLDGNVVYDRIVKPKGNVLDCNTRWDLGCFLEIVSGCNVLKYYGRMLIWHSEQYPSVDP